VSYSCVAKDQAYCTRDGGDYDVLMSTAPSGVNGLGGEVTNGDCFKVAEACPQPLLHDTSASDCRAKVASDCTGSFPAFMTTAPSSGGVGESTSNANLDCYATDVACPPPLVHDGTGACGDKTQASCVNGSYTVFMATAPSTGDGEAGAGTNANKDCYDPTVACPSPTVHDGTDQCRPKTQTDCTVGSFTAFMATKPTVGNG